jgi:serine kinase of HPr protein (carbohydrate metabolism regulator)
VIAHAGLVAQRLSGRWCGVLIEGASGAGKSDVALRALDIGFRLVADDRTVLWASGGRLYGRAPDTLAGLIEIRGQGVVQMAALPLAEVALVVRAGAPERMPEPQTTQILGMAVPLLVLDLRDASAPAKLRRALTCFDLAVNRRI